MINKALYNLLKDNSGVAALVSDRIYPGKLPQKPTYPAISYILVSGTERFSVMGDDADIARKRMRLSCWADSDSGLQTLKEAVRAAVQRYRGTVAGVVILDSFLEFESQLYDDDLKIWQYIFDVRFIHREA